MNDLENVCGPLGFGGEGGVGKWIYSLHTCGTLKVRSESNTQYPSSLLTSVQWAAPFLCVGRSSSVCLLITNGTNPATQPTLCDW